MENNAEILDEKSDENRRINALIITTWYYLKYLETSSKYTSKKEIWTWDLSLFPCAWRENSDTVWIDKLLFFKQNHNDRKG